MSRHVLQAFLLASLVFFPTVRADGEESIRDSTSPVTGEYLDLVTNLLYHYDASTGVLTPVGASAAPLGYGVSDLYPRGYSPDLMSGDVGACTFDFCDSTLVAVVGAKKVTVRIESVGYRSECGTTLRVQEYPALVGVVTYVKLRWNINHCGHGVATVMLHIDGVMYDHETIAY